MRKLPIFLLLATAAAAPSVAAIQDSDSRAERRAERKAERAERSEARSQQRAERPARAERPERAERMQRVQRVAPTQSGDNVRQQGEGTAERLRERRLARDNATSGAFDGALVPRESRIRTIPETQPVLGDRRDTRDDRRETRRERRADYRNGDYRRWEGNHWRRDRRYDWRSWRDRHRSIFRLGFYYDPFGYSYRRFSIGFNLWPSHYSSRYWLNDPWQYRLPPAYGPYRWVRYWDDALLVNIYTGEVVDVIHSFFW